jgi:hypothetical protein
VPLDLPANGRPGTESALCRLTCLLIGDPAPKPGVAVGPSDLAPVSLLPVGRYSSYNVHPYLNYARCSNMKGQIVRAQACINDRQPGSGTPIRSL